MFKIGDRVSIKEWDKIDKSNYTDEKMLEDSEEYINQTINHCGRKGFKIIKCVSDDNDDEDNILEFDISKGYITKQIYHFEIEPYFTVNLPDELFKI